MSRTDIPAANELLDLYFPVGDKGHVALLDYFGGDLDVEAAARVSYSKGTRKVSDARTLIRLLMRNNHSSPLEMCSLKFHLKMPLYVIQQLLRHRTAKINMASYRYSEVPDEYEVTQPDKWRLQSTDNKQGSQGFLRKRRERGQSYEDYWDGEELCSLEFGIHQELKDAYHKRLQAGIAREQARKDIPVSTYSSLYWNMDLRNLLHFMSLRCDHHAQLEIREFANVIAGIVKKVYPILYEGWIDYAYAAKSFSRLDILFLNSLVTNYSNKMSDWQSEYERDCYDYGKDEVKPHEQVGLTKRELAELWQKLTPVEIPVFDLDLSKAKTLEQMVVE